MEFYSNIVEKVLSLMRKWGWEAGLKKLRAEIEATEDADERAALQLFVSGMAGESGLHAEALERFKAIEQLPTLAGWALVGQAFVTMR